MKKLILAIVALFIANLTIAQTRSFSANVEGSQVAWVGEKLIGSSHNGTINLQSGTLTFANGVPTKGEFVIDMSSIVCLDVKDTGKNGYLVGHLKNDDFFGVDKYPTSKVVIEKASKKGSSFVLSGTIEIKGKKEAISFPVVIEKVGNQLKAKANLSVDRTKFGIRYGSKSFFDNLGDKAISNEFKLAIELLLDESNS